MIHDTRHAPHVTNEMEGWRNKSGSGMRHFRFTPRSKELDDVWMIESLHQFNLSSDFLSPYFLLCGIIFQDLIAPNKKKEKPACQKTF